VHVEALPEGWLGKMQTLHRGLALATEDWVLLSDADVHLAPGALEAIVAYAENERADMLAVFPQMRSVRWSPWIPLVVMIAPLALDLGIPIAAIMSGHVAAGLLALGLATLTHLVLAIHIAAPIAGALLWPLGQIMNALFMGRAGMRAWREQGVWWRGTFHSRAVVDAGRRIDLPSLRIRGLANANRVD